jgi:inward rectifier potassium channel
MRKPSFDPGITQQFTLPVTRLINEDGSFNVQRRGVTWRDFHPYLRLINMSWLGFFVTLLTGFLLVNTLFACLYYIIGTGQLAGVNAPTPFGRFLETFFFSSQTLTTVGYGGISPRGLAANAVAALESLCGVLGFAVATGLLFGRVSRPSARIGFSRYMLVAPYGDGMSLQFRVVNRRSNSLVELEASVMLMTVDPSDGEQKRHYKILTLEREKVIFFPLTWTVVHPIDPASPLYGMTEEHWRERQAEVLILIRAYDDTFSQTVLARHSYRHDELIWNRHFAPAFYVDERGELVLELKKLGELV